MLKLIKNLLENLVILVNIIKEDKLMSGSISNKMIKKLSRSQKLKKSQNLAKLKNFANLFKFHNTNITNI